jgi:hypothetical protein
VRQAGGALSPLAASTTPRKPSKNSYGAADFEFLDGLKVTAADMAHFPI